MSILYRQNNCKAQFFLSGTYFRTFDLKLARTNLFSYFRRPLNKKDVELFSFVSDEAARRNVRQKKPISVTKKLNSIGTLKIEGLKAKINQVLFSKSMKVRK